MQRRKHQVAGLCSFESDFDSLFVPHLAHQDDLGRLAQCRPQGQREAGCIAMQLALMDDAVLVGMQEFDGVLDGQNMVVMLLVDHVDDRRQGGGLSRPRRARRQHHSVSQGGDVPEFGRQIEILEARNFTGDNAHHHRATATLHEHVDAKS